MKSEYIEEDKIKEIALQIQSEFQMGGLADGIYLDFAIEVAKRYDDFRRGTALTQTHNNALKVAVKEIEKILDRHIKWTPTEGYGSDEEKGYQKGLIAEAKLIKHDISEAITNIQKLEIKS